MVGPRAAVGPPVRPEEAFVEGVELAGLVAGRYRHAVERLERVDVARLTRLDRGVHRVTAVDDLRVEARAVAVDRLVLAAGRVADAQGDDAVGGGESHAHGELV